MYLRINEAAERIGCSSSSLRDYDREGILVPMIRMETGERRYTIEQVDEFIAKLGCELEDGDRMMSRGEVLEYLGVSMSVLRRLENEGRLKVVRKLPGGKKFYSANSAYEYMKSVWVGGSDG